MAGFGRRLTLRRDVLVQVDAWSEYGAHHETKPYRQPISISLSSRGAMELWEEDHIHVGGSHS